MVPKIRLTHLSIAAFLNKIGLLMMMSLLQLKIICLKGGLASQMRRKCDYFMSKVYLRNIQKKYIFKYLINIWLSNAHDFNFISFRF